MLSKSIDNFIINVKDVSKCYHIYNKPHQRLIQSFLGSKKKLYKDFWALRGVSFEVKKGETLGIIGLNGSGKSTLLQIICGTLSPTEGDVEVSGRLAALLELGAGFNPQFTGRENVYMNGALMGISSREMDQRVHGIEAFAEIGEFIDQPIKTYSSGMFVRLAFASAINVDPDILIIDEALAVGDMVFQHRCMSKILELKKTKTIIFVSHSISNIVSICDKVIWLNEGKLMEEGDPKTVSDHYQAYVHTLNAKYAMNRFISSEVSNHFGFGNKRAKINEVRGLDRDGKNLLDLTAGRIMRLEILARCNQEIDRPAVGFNVKDQRGVIIFSSDTNLEGVSLPKLRSGEKIAICFTFSWPELASGSYSFSPFIADGTEKPYAVCDWVYDALVLQASNGKGTIGLISLNNVTTEFKVTPQIKI